MINIAPIPAFTDNYIWLISHAQRAWVVDPGDAQPVLNYLQQNNLTLAGILLTHYHFDHIGGVNKLLSNAQVPVYGNPQKISQVTEALNEGDKIKLENIELEVIAVPGHTLDHIAYFGHIPEQGPCLFCGDTLFSAGCGRLFEGTPEQMLRSLEKLKQLPVETKVFCAHEYTLANLAFAREVMPESQHVQQRLTECEQSRAQHQPTLPARLGDELRYNPFLMADDDQVINAASQRLKAKPANETEVFATIRQWKDSF